MKVQKKVFDEKLDNLDVEHSDELRLIDTKVRKIYQMRDDTISSLREKLSVAEKRQREVESILADLNSGFSSAPSCRISKHSR